MTLCSLWANQSGPSLRIAQKVTEMGGPGVEAPTCSCSKDAPCWEEHAMLVVRFRRDLVLRQL